MLRRSEKVVTCRNNVALRISSSASASKPVEYLPFFFAAAVKGLELLTKLDAVQLQASFADLPLSDSSTKEIGIIIVKRCSGMFFLTK